jgi:hypothetical protein
MIGAKNALSWLTGGSDRAPHDQTHKIATRRVHPTCHKESIRRRFNPCGEVQGWLELP